MKSPNHQPPRRAEQFLEWFVREDIAEEVLGDLEEKFYVTLDKKSPFRAKLNYWYQVFNYLRPFALRKSFLSHLFPYAMYKNYYKVAWRNLFKNKMYSTIKIGGFAIGIAACLLITLYIQDELSYDKHYEEKDRIFRLLNTFNEDGSTQKWEAFPAPIAQALRDGIPEIEKVGRLIPYDWFEAGNNQLRPADQAENTYEEGFAYLDPEILDILEVSMVYGNRAEALKDPNTILISRRKAEKYFPGEDPIGKVLLINDNEERPYKVGGVMENFPENSHLQFNFFLTLSGVEFWPGEQGSWCCSNYNPYVRLAEGVDVAAVQEKLTLIKDKHMIPYLQKEDPTIVLDVQSKHGFELQSVQDIYLQSRTINPQMPTGDERIVWMFGIIALFILLLACVNFINLSTAKSSNRAKEVGLRKVVGSKRRNLIQQFLAESTLFSLISFGLGILMAEVLLPYFNTLAGKSMDLDWTQPWLIPAILGGSLFIGILAGLYPSFYLSSFQPVNVLKGNLKLGSKGSGLRSVLVVFQFGTSVVLIIGAMVVHRQMDYILNKDLGFEKEQVLLIQGTNTLDDKYSSFKKELKRITAVNDVSISSYMPIKGTKRDQNGFWNEGRTKIDKSIGAQIWYVDEDYISTMGMKLVDGRNFDPDRASDSSAIIINRSMARKFGFEKAESQRITNGFSPTFTVIGIIEDFHFETMKDKIRPLALTMGNQGSIVPVKVHSADIQTTLTAITEVWDTFMPNQPIRYSFLDDKFALMYADVKKTEQIFSIFAGLAILVACLGLFALSAYMIEQRRKEISIRKVLGASSQNLFKILTSDFLKLVCISLFIAMPLGWYGMQKWLENFSYRIDITWDIFFWAGITTLVIALLTISYESIKITRMAPAGNLRSE